MNMKQCPCCGGTLKHGLLRSSGLIFWSEGEEQGLYTPVQACGDIVPPGSSRFQGSDCPADYCETCQLLLLSTKEEETI